jgi:hypothetical protein
MALTMEGALKIAAGKTGLGIDEYTQKIKSGQKWCSGCKDWHPRNCFGKDRSAYDGLCGTCIDFRNTRSRKKYKKKNRASKKGTRLVKTRDGDKRQARARINHLIRLGLLPDPNTRVCSSCRNTKKSKRNEYHHHKGYAAEHHESVIVLCSVCHAELHKNRKQEE